MHPGQGPGLSSHQLGEKAGQESVTLAESQIPAHTHTAYGTQEPATSNTPGNTFWAATQGNNRKIYDSSSKPNAAMNPNAIGTAGSSQEHENMQPYLCLNFIIALEGIYPSRS
jgi:microcystin-dependent protein